MKIIIKLTHDNWHGNYNGNQVHLKCIGNICSYDKKLKPIYRVMVSGNDDFSMVFDTLNKEESLKLFETLKQMDFLDIEELEKMGLKVY